MAAPNTQSPPQTDLTRVTDALQRIVVALNTLTAAVTKTRANSTSSPANPTGTASTSGVMMGIDAGITPQSSGTVVFLVNGDVASGPGGKLQLRYGTGSAPANGASPTGNAIGGDVQIGSSVSGFALIGLATGLSLSTAYWFDVELATASGTTSLANITCIAFEL